MNILHVKDFTQQKKKKKLQNFKATNWMGVCICKWDDGDWFDIKNIKTAHINQYAKKEQPV